MKRFSERMGITKPLEIQLDCMNDELRNSLWNIILIRLERYTDSELRELCNRLAFHFFKITIDSIRGLGYTNYGFSRSIIEDWIKEKFYRLQWYEAYEFIEYLVRNEKGFEEERFQEILNKVLEREYCGYRLTDGIFAPITNEQEIKEIEEAIEGTTRVGIEEVSQHLSTALSSFAKSPWKTATHGKHRAASPPCLTKQIRSNHTYPIRLKPAAD